MIAVDTSAVTAIVLDEPERGIFQDTILHAAKALISTVSVVEVKMVLYGRRGARAVVLAEDFRDGVKWVSGQRLARLSTATHFNHRRAAALSSVVLP